MTHARRRSVAYGGNPPGSLRPDVGGRSLADTSQRGKTCDTPRPIRFACIFGIPPVRAARTGPHPIRHLAQAAYTNCRAGQTGGRRRGVPRPVEVLLLQRTQRDRRKYTPPHLDQNSLTSPDGVRARRQNLYRIPAPTKRIRTTPPQFHPIRVT